MLRENNRRKGFFEQSQYSALLQNTAGLSEAGNSDRIHHRLADQVGDPHAAETSRRSRTPVGYGWSRVRARAVRDGIFH